MVLTHIAVLSIKFLLATEFLKFILRKVNKNYLIEFQFQIFNSEFVILFVSWIRFVQVIQMKEFERKTEK
jgi:hypothetical protein